MATRASSSTIDFERFPSPDERYPFVGPNYQAHGEVPGFVYYPWDDQYYVDPQAQEQYQESIGNGPEKPPSLTEQVTPLAVAGGALALGTGFGKDPGGFVGGIKDSIGGLIGLGDKPAAATAASPASSGAAATAATPALPSVPGGLIGAAPTSQAPSIAAPTFELGGEAAGYAGTPGIGAGVAPHSYGLLGLNSTVPGLSGSALSAGGVAAGAYTGYQQAQGIKDIAQGHPMGFTEEAALALPTFGASFAVDPINKAFGSGKDNNQRAQEAIVGDIQDTMPDFLSEDNDYGIQLDDGSYFSLGGTTIHPTYGAGGKAEDGGILEGIAPDDKSFNIDWSREGIGELVGQTQLLGFLISGKDPESTEGSQFIGKLTNAALSNGNPEANVRAIARNARIDWAQGRDKIRQANEQGRITDQQRDAMYAEGDRIFGAVNAPEGYQGPRYDPAVGPLPTQAPRSQQPQAQSQSTPGKADSLLPPPPQSAPVPASQLPPKVAQPAKPSGAPAVPIAPYWNTMPAVRR